MTNDGESGGFIVLRCAASPLVPGSVTWAAETQEFVAAAAAAAISFATAAAAAATALAPGAGGPGNRGRRAAGAAAGGRCLASIVRNDCAFRGDCFCFGCVGNAELRLSSGWTIGCLG